MRKLSPVAGKYEGGPINSFLYRVIHYVNLYSNVIPIEGVICDRAGNNLNIANNVGFY